MANNQPPYQKPIYLESIQLKQVAEVTSISSGGLLDTDFINAAEANIQQWYLDPSDMSTNEYFVKINSDHTLVLESPTEESARAFINLQGNRYQNGGIQVWILEEVLVGPSIWVLKNYKTGMYVYLDYNGTAGQTKVPIIVRNASPQDQNAQWKIVPVQQ